jgi:hypothetical protein
MEKIAIDALHRLVYAIATGWHIPCWIDEQIDQGQTEEHVTRRRAKWLELGSGDDPGLPQNRNRDDRVDKSWIVGWFLDSPRTTRAKENTGEHFERQV